MSFTNNKGEMNLTFMLIGIIAFVGVVILAFGAYSTFLSDNSQTVDPALAASFENISAQQGTLTTVSNNFESNTGTILNVIANAPQYIFTTLMVGGTIILSFLQLPALMIGIITSIQSVIPIPSALIWVFTTIIGVIVASLVLKTIRGGEQP
jgi:hypothetical protein